MKNNKLLLSTSFIYLLSISLCSCNATYKAPKGQPDYSNYEKDNIIRISGWVAPPPSIELPGMTTPNLVNNESYKAIKELGFNSIYALYESYDDSNETTKQAAHFAKENGINYYARDTHLFESFEEGYLKNNPLVNKYLDDCAGHLVYDEPRYSVIKDLVKLKNYYEQELIGKDFYCNLNPTYLPRDYLEGHTYEEYVREYIDKLNPKYVSFDHYALRKYDDKYSITYDCLLNYEIIAKVCKENNIPFMGFVKTCTSRDFDQRLFESEEELRWQVMLNLAYGSTGIQYFCCFTPATTSEGGFTPALFDLEGNKTIRYDFVKHLNKYISNIDATYLNFAWNETITIEGTNNSKDLDEYEIYVNPSFDMVYKDEYEEKYIKNIKANEDTIIGCFNSKVDNYKAYLISNFTDPCENKIDTVSANFVGANRLLVFDKDETKIIKINKGDFVYNLEPGNGIFVIPFNK